MQFHERFENVASDVSILLFALRIREDVLVHFLESIETNGCNISRYRLMLYNAWYCITVLGFQQICLYMNMVHAISRQKYLQIFAASPMLKI